MAKSPLTFNIDVDSIVNEVKDMGLKAKAQIERAVEELSKQTHAHIVEQAQNGPKKLHSSLNQYKDNLTKAEEIFAGVYVITLNEPAMWIEEGKESGDMKPGLLKGAKFKVIPFDQNKRPQDRSETDNQIHEQLTDGLKKINRNLRKQKLPEISLSKLEYDASGSPRIGKLHELKMDSNRPTSNAKHPALNGLAIYQRENPETKKVERQVLTFRTVSVNSDPDSWMYPGFEGRKFFDEAYQWAMNEWETKILPELLANLGK